MDTRINQLINYAKDSHHLIIISTLAMSTAAAAIFALINAQNCQDQCDHPVALIHGYSVSHITLQEAYKHQFIQYLFTSIIFTILAKQELNYPLR